MPKQKEQIRKRIYFKIFIIENLGTGLINDVLLLLMKYVGRNNRLELTPDKKAKIASQLKATPHYVDVCLNRFLKADIMQREGKGLYFINPYRFAKASASEIEKLYLTYLEVKHSCSKEAEKNNSKYKLSENRCKRKKELPANTFPINQRLNNG